MNKACDRRGLYAAWSLQRGVLLEFVPAVTTCCVGRSSLYPLSDDHYLCTNKGTVKTDLPSCSEHISLKIYA